MIITKWSKNFLSRRNFTLYKQNRGRNIEISLFETLMVWLEAAFTGFGGPAGQIATLHRILVQDREWLTEDEFINILNYCVALPGPEAFKIAIYVGWLTKGTLGGILAGLFIILPSLFFVFAIGLVYAFFSHIPVVNGMFLGAKAAVVAIVIEAVVKIAKKMPKGAFFIAIGALSFFAKYLFGISFGIILLFAIIAGVIHEYLGFGKFGRLSIAPEIIPHNFFYLTNFRVPKTFLLYSLKILIIFGCLWFLPILAIRWLLPAHSLLETQFWYYSKLSLVTFGGAYAVLSQIANEASQVFGWISQESTVEVLSLSEAVPGPLIMFAQIVAFLTSFYSPEVPSILGISTNVISGIAGIFICGWVTYIPPLMVILAFSPYIEYFRHNKIIGKILNSVTVAVMGVLIDFSIWFIQAVLFKKLDVFTFYKWSITIPDFSSISINKLIISLIAIFLVFKTPISTMWTIIICSLIGVGFYFI